MSNKSKEVDNFINYLKSTFTIIKTNPNDDINFHVIIPKKIKVLNFMEMDKLEQTPGFSNVSKILHLVQPTDLDLDDFRDIYGNLNIALASGDGNYNKYGDPNSREYPNVMKYQNSARIHLHWPKFGFDEQALNNFNWILNNHFENKILMIWLDISTEAIIPQEFIKLFENKVDYITTDDHRINLRPEIAASILKKDGLIKVGHDDRRYNNNSDFEKVKDLGSIDPFYSEMFLSGGCGWSKIYTKK